MIPTRDAEVFREETLPEAHAHGGGKVSVLRLAGGRVVVKRFAARGKVVNLVDRYERVLPGGGRVVMPLDVKMANRVVDAALAGKKSWAACFVVDDTGEAAPPIDWVRTDAEHRFTSTGQKFWRHREQMESYRAGTGRTVVSTHVSPEGACNLRCGYCSVTYRDTHSHIPLPRVKRYLSDLKSRGLKAVIFTGGGEPTLYPSFGELVAFAKRDLGLSVALITNGTTADRVASETWRAFSWVRVSVNVFDGWEERIRIPTEHLSADCVVGSSFVYSVEHEAAPEDVPLDRVDLLRRVAGVADRIGAKYVRLLPNCLLEQAELLGAHRALQADLQRLGDDRFFQQYKIHRAPNADFCHQSVFRPYLSEEPFGGPEGEPGTVYPCDSVVLNDSLAHFSGAYRLCRAEDVLRYLDGEIEGRFNPKRDCTGCVFTESVEQLGAWKAGKLDRFASFPDPMLHEEFV